MLPTPAEAALLSLSFIVPLALLLLLMRPYLGYLVRRGRVVDDLHKSPPTKVPSPAGPLLFLSALIGEVVAYLAFGSLVPIALVGVTSVAFVVGLTDDLYVLGAKAKPLALLLAAAPLVGAVMFQPDLYEPSLAFPLFGTTSEHFTTYTILAVAALPVVANAFNMMDAFNGEISGFSLLTSLTLVFAVLLHTMSAGDYSFVHLASALPLVAVSLGFFMFNRYPSKAFDGDSGSLMLGAMFAGLAITGGVEIAAIVAIMPAILNSFYILSSVRGLVERRKMGGRPTYIGEDGRIHASLQNSAPATLVRMILFGGPMSEKHLVRAVLGLTVVACVLSGITSVLTWVF